MTESTTDLLAKIAEYEHALEHIAEDSEFHRPAACEDCQRLARSALDGVNRADFREIVSEQDVISEPAEREVDVHLLNQPYPEWHYAVVKTYTENDLFCLLLINGTIEKYPIANIFRIVEHQ